MNSASVCLFPLPSFPSPPSPPPLLTGVHGDKDAEGGAQAQLGALKLKGLQAHGLGALHRQDLLRNHRQHLQVGGKRGGRGPGVRSQGEGARCIVKICCAITDSTYKGKMEEQR